MTRKGRVVWLQPVFPAYTQPLIDELSERLGPDGFSVVGGRDYFAETVTTELRPDTCYVEIPNRYLLGRRLLWQRRAWREAGQADTLMMELNPRILSGWWLLIARRILRRRTVLYGHAFPRQGAGSATDRVRGLLRRLADAVIVYTESEAAQLRAAMRPQKVYAAPNAFLHSSQIGPAVAASPPRDFLCVGRLVEEKKPELLIEAFRRALPDLPADARLIFVGDGSLRAGLERWTAEEPRIEFLGEVHQRDRLKDVYSGAIATVSPGSVGLSLIQSLSFGVPMIFPRDEPHGPEVEAAQESKNAILIDSNSVGELAAALVRTANARSHWAERRGEIAEWCASRYSVDLMADRVMSAIQGLS